MEAQSALNRLPFWNTLSEKEKAAAARGFTQRTYEKGAYILGFSDACLGMVYLRKGSVRVFITSEAGREITLFHISEGESCVFSSACAISGIALDVQMVAESETELSAVHAGTVAISDFIDTEFNTYAAENGLECHYQSFSFAAKESDELAGVITGYAIYKEVHIRDLIVLKNYRNKKIGTKLIEAVEQNFKNKGFENINLTTYSFQAPEFYRKCGFETEFVRENKTNKNLSKYFFVKNL